MKKSKIIGFVLLVLMLLNLLGACGEKENTVQLTLSIAASLTEAMEEVKKIYQDENHNVELILNFGSSGALFQQIEQGAPVDVYFSAASKYMKQLQEKDLILKESRVDFLENRIVLIAAKEASNIQDFTQLTDESIKKIAMGAPDSVPAGKYAQEVMNTLGNWEPIQTKIVLAKDVRQVLAYVETENTDVGMVYQTDASISSKVKIIATAPLNSHTPIIYPYAVLKNSKHLKEAQAFAKFLETEKAKAVFEKYGFSIH